MLLRSTWVGGALAGAVLAAAAVFAAAGAADSPDGPSLTSVPNANTRSDGYAPANLLSPELRQIVLAQGSNKLENPNAADKVAYYGYDSDVVNAAGEPQMVATGTSPAAEASKTEPDKNVYLVFKNGLPGGIRPTTTGRTSFSRATRRARSGT